MRRGNGRHEPAPHRADGDADPARAHREHRARELRLGEPRRSDRCSDRASRASSPAPVWWRTRRAGQRGGGLAHGPGAIGARVPMPLTRRRERPARRMPTPPTRRERPVRRMPMPPIRREPSVRRMPSRPCSGSAHAPALRPMRRAARIIRVRSLHPVSPAQPAGAAGARRTSSGGHLSSRPAGAQPRPQAPAAARGRWLRHHAPRRRRPPVPRRLRVVRQRTLIGRAERTRRNRAAAPVVTSTCPQGGHVFFGTNG